MTKYPNVKIRQRGPYGPLFEEVPPVNEEEELADLRPFICSMMRLVLKNKLEHLTANQCGLDRQIMITAVPGDYIRILVNPTMQVIDYDEEEWIEYCPSFPRNKKGVPRLRHAHVLVEAYNYKGEKVIVDTTTKVLPPDVAARLSATLQHCMEHLHGIDVREEPEMSIF